MWETSRSSLLQQPHSDRPGTGPVEQSLEAENTHDLSVFWGWGVVRLDGSRRGSSVLPPDRTHLHLRWRGLTARNRTMGCDEMWRTCKFQCTTPPVLICGLRINLYLSLKETWTSPPPQGENMRGWNTSNDMWDWYSCVHIRFGSDTFFSTARSHRCPVYPAKHLVEWVERKRDKALTCYTQHMNTWTDTQHRDSTTHGGATTRPCHHTAELMRLSTCKKQTKKTPHRSPIVTLHC